eukprot:COSAG02_NODE_51792_length_312_cov_0.446009_1_plen_64_part_00
MGPPCLKVRPTLMAWSVQRSNVWRRPSPPGAEQEAGTDSTQRPPTSSGADSPRGRFDPQLVSW